MDTLTYHMLSSVVILVMPCMNHSMPFVWLTDNTYCT